MSTRFYITLDKSERYALGKLAEREYRDPRRQASLLIRQGLERAGALPKTGEKMPEMAQMSQGVENDPN